MVRITASIDRAEKLLSLAALAISIELVLFKFLPDLSTALIQHSRSALTDFTAFEEGYLTPGSVHHARFLGNYILYGLAKLLDLAYHSADPRLHPLRVAAGILTPAYAWLGAHFALREGAGLAWRYFMVPYALAVVIGLYVFYPADMPSLAFLSIALFLLLRERMLAALLLTLVTGLFRETSLHMVVFVAIWAWCNPGVSLPRRISWLGVFALAFLVEYVAVRHFFPGPVSSAGGIIVDPRTLFLGAGLLSLTTVCSLALAVLFPIACLVRIRALPGDDWRYEFFKLNCYAFPAWIIFYRMMNGNLSEFRMLFPVLLPCIYGIAFGAQGQAAPAPGKAA
jgi:hypothetical protein